ncbi:hypothetical protein [Streptomyces albipurpureus]|uniref:Uncharacterized protein n=1 Tax=Streptomyces albipurpureus TaxID=2897419 RepID=A0ABT0UXU5_9ACTN|nr:hypothetical protein [Streptomyces sp. CWNU-1]MCM2392153.1 hypothetical protein [Streptomyces sp. CWNU-1]
MTDHYPYRISVERRDLFLIWRPGEGDEPAELIVDAHGRLAAFDDLQALEEHCANNRWELVPEVDDALDLRPVRQWVKHPHLRLASAGLLLEAWNFFDDLSHSLKARSSMPSQGAIHNMAYEKIYSGDPLSRHSGEDAWTDEETAAVRELLRAGLKLWERAVAASDTPSRTGGRFRSRHAARTDQAPPARALLPESSRLPYERSSEGSQAWNQ